MARSLSRSLSIEFYNRPADDVAKDLLGKKVVRITASGRLEGIITETEAYTGVRDKASHAHGGRRTKRNEIMYGRAGRVYVYFTYGMHWLMNFIVSKEGDPQAVLIRGIEGVSGPARVTKYFQIDKSFYGEDLSRSKRLWVEETGIRFKNSDIEKLPRVGINYAEEWKDKPLRFMVRNSNVKI